MKFLRFLYLFFLLLGYAIFLFNCNQDKKDTQKKLSNLTIKWGRITDSLLRDTTNITPVVDSLKKQILDAPDDTSAINYLNMLAQEWKNEPNLILANEAAEKSKKINYKYGEIDALSRIGYYYYWTDDYPAADSTLRLALNLATKFTLKKLQVQVLSVIGKVVRIQGNYPQALVYFRQGLNIASKIGDKNQSAFCLNSIGEVYRLESDNFEALYYFQQSLAISKQTGDKNRIASALSSMGDIYRLQDDYSKALDYFQQALAIAAQTGDINMSAFCLNNMGEIYLAQGEYTKGLDYFQQSLSIAKKMGDNTRISSCLSSLGSTYFAKEDYTKALDYYEQTIKIAREIGDNVKIAGCLNGIGGIYTAKKENLKALDYFYKSLKIAKEMEDKILIAECLNNIGGLYFDMNDIANAQKNAEAGMSAAKECNTPGMIRGAAELLYKVYDKNKNYKEAYKNHSLYIEMKDSIVNKVSMKKFAAQEYKAKEAEFKTEQLKKDISYKAEKIQKETELNQQKIVRNGFIIGAILLCGLVFFVYRNLKQSKKAHKIITEQKKQVEEQKSITEEQKKLLEEKQKEIVDSINYAKRIQHALFAQDEILKQNLKEYFVVFKPKDIISGDFYWATEKIRSRKSEVGSEKEAGDSGKKAVNTGRYYLAVCDSTGHGVPGAFMSLLNISFLNEAATEKNIVKPNEILNHVRKRLIKTISQDGKQDGMDGILVCFENDTISYAAAHNTPVVISDKKFTEYPTDKMPIGKGEKEESFTLHSIKAKKGDVIYLYTDGYADQFGGNEGKKFMQKQLKELLFANHQLPMDKQKEILENKFEDWRGELEQVDDVTIIGIRI